MSETPAESKATRRGSAPEPTQASATTPGRKRPLVLALAMILLAGWLVFLALMAYG